MGARGRSTRCANREGRSPKPISTPSRQVSQPGYRSYHSLPIRDEKSLRSIPRTEQRTGWEIALSTVEYTERRLSPFIYFMRITKVQTARSTMRSTRLPERKSNLSTRHVITYSSTVTVPRALAPDLRERASPPSSHVCSLYQYRYALLAFATFVATLPFDSLITFPLASLAARETLHKITG